MQVCDDPQRNRPTCRNEEHGETGLGDAHHMGHAAVAVAMCVGDETKHDYMWASSWHVLEQQVKLSG